MACVRRWWRRRLCIGEAVSCKTRTKSVDSACCSELAEAHAPADKNPFSCTSPFRVQDVQDETSQA